MQVNFFILQAKGQETGNSTALQDFSVGQHWKWLKCQFLAIHTCFLTRNMPNTEGHKAKKR